MRSIEDIRIMDKDKEKGKVLLMVDSDDSKPVKGTRSPVCLSAVLKE